MTGTRRRSAAATRDQLCWCGLPVQVVADHECTYCRKHCEQAKRRAAKRIKGSTELVQRSLW